MVRELNTSTRGYVQILEDTTSSEEARAEALNELNREFNGIIDLEADQATQYQASQRSVGSQGEVGAGTYQTKPNAYNLARSRSCHEADYNTVVSEYKGFWESGRQAQERLQKESLDANEANEKATKELAEAHGVQRPRW